MPKKILLGIVLALATLAGTLTATSSPAGAAYSLSLEGGGCNYAYHTNDFYAFDCGWHTTDYDTYHVTMFHYNNGWIHTLVWSDEPNWEAAIEVWTLDKTLPELIVAPDHITFSWNNNRSLENPNGVWHNHSLTPEDHWQMTTHGWYGGAVQMQSWVMEFGAYYANNGWGGTSGIAGAWCGSATCQHLVLDEGQGVWRMKTSHIEEINTGVGNDEAYLAVK